MAHAETHNETAGDAALRVAFCGLRFNTPLVLLSGCVGFGDEYTRVEGFSHKELGAVCLKGTTLEARLGNPAHRIAETEDGMLNAIGLQNPGVDALVNDILPALDFKQTHYIANIAGAAVEEYGELARRLDDTPISAIEINISCPNVKEGGTEFGNNAETSARIVECCRRLTTKPLITKLSPNQTDIAENARRCLEAGSDAFAVINTVAGMAIDIDSRRPLLANHSGGLSGPAIKPIALLKVFAVYQVCRPHGIPIIGQGGVVSGRDAIEFMLAGATAVGLGTALFYEPLVCADINRTLAAYLRQHQFPNVQALVGALKMPEPTPH